MLPGREHSCMSAILEMVIMLLSPVFRELRATIQADGCAASSNKVFHSGSYSGT